jgi:DNA-directed RNA polymerase specialized sigma24 family protein
MPHEQTDDRNWQRILDSDDETDFRHLVEPYLDDLLEAAQHDIDYYVHQGDLHADDLTPEEVTGEALVYAWTHRAQRPDGMSLIGWLLGTQYRVLRDLVAQRKKYRAEKTLSLDEPIPSDVWIKGQEGRRQYPRAFPGGAETTWKALTTGSEPREIEAPLFTNRDTFALDPDSRHVVMMHDEFDLPLSEIASAMDVALQDAERMLADARTSLHDLEQDRSPPASDTPSASPPPPGAESA